MHDNNHLLDPEYPPAVQAPNFFVLGAAKCGTTSLDNMLRQHPSVFMPLIKEPSFFCSHFQAVRNPVQYYGLFQSASADMQVGEASHLNFSNPETAPIIRALFPEARFILIFRNPVNRAYSLYQWMKRYGYENALTFEEALRLEPQRFRSPNFIKNCNQYFWNYMYVRSSYYHIQWKRYLRFFDRSRFFTLTLEELAGNTSYWMSQIYRFLDVDPDFKPAIQKQNVGEYPEIESKTRRLLDDHFEETRRQTIQLSEREIGLDGL